MTKLHLMPGLHGDTTDGNIFGVCLTVHLNVCVHEFFPRLLLLCAALNRRYASHVHSLATIRLKLSPSAPQRCKLVSNFCKNTSSTKILVMFHVRFSSAGFLVGGVATSCNTCMLTCQALRPGLACMLVDIWGSLLNTCEPRISRFGADS